MTKRIIFIILGALLLIALIALLWLWLFNRPATTPTSGTFDSAGSRSGTGSTGTQTPTNIPSATTGGNNTGSGSIIKGTPGSGNTAYADLGTVGATTSGSIWLGDGPNGIGGGSITSFTPKAINQLNNGNVSGTPAILGSSGAGAGDSGSGINGNALIGVGIGTALCTAGLLGNSAGGIAGSAVSSLPTAAFAVQTNSVVTNAQLSSDQLRENFLNCIARSIARAAIQQITASVVNWINSGFNGQPSFVKDYDKFFNNVLEQAAGEYIKGSALSFLCSPFQAQIKIALAQSYAKRNSGQTCTLSSAVGNVNKFVNGNFSSGGWGGLISYTTTPTNNPFGAYAYAQVGLTNAQNQAYAKKQQDYVIGGGFLSSTKQTNCRTIPPPAGQQGPPQTKCDTEVSTPGSTISASLSKTLGTSIDSLNLAKSFDEIISALVTQLMTKTLYSGLGSLSGTSGYASDYLTPEQQQAQKDAQLILTDMQGKVQIAQQYGTVQQGSIQDLQNTQQQIQGLVNCWETASSSPSLSASAQRQASLNAATALGTLHSYDSEVDVYNNNITKANNGIVALQELQTRAINVTSAADVASVTADYQSALNSGVLISQSDVTSAQQNRTTLQSRLSVRNQQTNAEIQQCYAYGQ